MIIKKVINKLDELFLKINNSKHTFLDQLLSLIPGKAGWVLRQYNFRGRIKMGSNAVIDEHVCIKYPERLSFGSDSFIGRCGMIQASGGVDIGNDVIIGPYVKIWSSDHNFDELDVPIQKQGHSFAKVIIEDNVWIGTGVIILKGVNIGKGSVCAAGSVVVNNVQPYTIVAGNPAKKIRSRLKNGIAK